MIDRLSIVNFQCHKTLTLDLCPGVNVIAGTSDVGKSAILKALLWLITNKPQGFGFRNWDCGKGESVVVEAALDNGNIVTRTRAEGVNEYRLNDRPYVAMKSDVPLDIAEALGMEAVNIQTQFMPHYLISTSSGEVARTLNEACDLSIIDAALKGINGVVTRSRSDAKAANEILDQLQDELTALNWVEDAAAALARVESEAGIVETRERRLTEIKAVLSDLDRLNTQSRELGALLALYAPIPEIVKLVSGVEEKERQIQNLSDIFEELEKVGDGMEAIHPLDPEAVAEASQAHDDFVTGSAQYTALREFLEGLTTLNDELCAADHDYAMSRDELAQAWAEVDACPLCGAAVEEGHAE